MLNDISGQTGQVDRPSLPELDNHVYLGSDRFRGEPKEAPVNEHCGGVRSESLPMISTHTLVEPRRRKSGRLLRRKLVGKVIC